ncbi:hypothetical protein [Clostridium botulinum]|uniref:hypothetical protein n=1 Tax=Clostridium botulinum TaxID=1491 RepID=UPI001C9BB3D0|nr:hypothetical protein [Clostridium botulinum]MBY6842891.1 hypothetical protein [Clostridium botulinum]
MENNDVLREMCINQGYVPSKCKLTGVLIMGLIQKGKNPCWGCNHDRNECGGCPKKLLEHNLLSEYDNKRYNNYIKEQNSRIEKEKREIKRLNSKSNELIMDISIERDRTRCCTYINIKDRIKEKCYTMKLNENINESCKVIIMFIEKFKIKEVHIDNEYIGRSLYDCLLYNLKIHNIDWCDVIGFTYRRLDFDTDINNYSEQSNNNKEFQFINFSI